MKKILLVLFLATTAFMITGSAQTAPDTTRMPQPEKFPAYKSGLNGWVRFLEKNLDRDLLAKQSAPSGRYTVIASFVVEADGTVKDIKIESDKGYGTAEEVKRIIQLTDKQWTPAYDKGQPISFRHRQSITFAH